jgi:hypothetical protein
VGQTSIGTRLEELSIWELCNTVLQMARKTASSMLTVRIDPRMARSLAREARKRRTTRSEVAREILANALDHGPNEDRITSEAKRQSILVSRRRSEKESLEFITAAADERNWR